MRFAPSSHNVKRRRAAFTLAEVLAALLFMAIVIPVALEGLRIASLAGQVGERKAVAARVAERVLSELAVTGSPPGGNDSGSIIEGQHEFQWTVESAAWVEDNALQETTVRVVYFVQGREYEVTVSTLTEAATL
jgi:type II secretory pathway pseudopilin PulG